MDDAVASSASSGADAGSEDNMRGEQHPSLPVKASSDTTDTTERGVSATFAARERLASRLHAALARKRQAKEAAAAAAAASSGDPSHGHGHGHDEGERTEEGGTTLYLVASKDFQERGRLHVCTISRRTAERAYDDLVASVSSFNEAAPHADRSKVVVELIRVPSEYVSAPGFVLFGAYADKCTAVLRNNINEDAVTRARRNAGDVLREQRFLRPLRASPELCAFFELPRNSVIARAEASRLMTQYLHTHRLLDGDDARYAFPDERLRELLVSSERLTRQREENKEGGKCAADGSVPGRLPHRLTRDALRRMWEEDMPHVPLPAPFQRVRVFDIHRRFMWPHLFDPEE